MENLVIQIVLGKGTVGVLGGAMNGHAVDQLYRPLLLELLQIPADCQFQIPPAPPPVRESIARLGDQKLGDLINTCHLFETHMVQSSHT